MSQVESSGDTSNHGDRSKRSGNTDNSSPHNDTQNSQFTNHAKTKGGRSGAIVSRYVKKNAFFAMLFAVLGLWGLQLLFSYLSEIDRISDTYTYADAFRYIAYRSPYFLEQFIATGALLGAVIGLGLLANNSELMVMRAAGISIYRIIGWVLQPAVLFVLLALGVNQFVLPHTNVLATREGKVDTALLASIKGYWTLQTLPEVNGKPPSSQIIYIDYADVDGNIGKVKRWQLDQNNQMVSVSEAQGGTYIGSIESADSSIETNQYQWQLNGINTVDIAKGAAFGSDSNNERNLAYSTALINKVDPLAQQQIQSKNTITLPIAPSSVSLLTRRAEDLSLTQLYAHKRFNESQGTRSLEHEVAFWQKLLSPFAILSLVLVACSFVFGSLRTSSLGLRIVIALLLGLLFSYMQDLVGFISLATGVSPFLMVLLPIVGIAILGLYLIYRKQ